MIRNLRDTTSRNEEQDWLKTNLAKFTRMLQGQKDLLTVGKLILSELAPVVSAQTGIFYIMDSEAPEPELRLLASYAFTERKHLSNRYRLGEGLVGQCALERQPILLTNVPSDYIQISSGLGQAVPMNIIVLPILFEGKVKAVIELASFQGFNPTHEGFLVQLAESIGIVLNTIKANTLTEDLLKQSQSLASELQNRQDELEKTNKELGDKAAQLAEQNEVVERKNSEVEQARTALEGKAQQLALTSKYKSEFLANMSHELRTPLNSLLILADQLGSNYEGNLTPKQVEFARTIHGSGRDLLRLINDILDLSKIESGNFTVSVTEVRLVDLMDNVERTFRHVAQEKGIDFAFELASDLPSRILTDEQRLDQVLKNLVSNALKFTSDGKVTVKVQAVEGHRLRGNSVLSGAGKVLAFSVQDTGIGIPPEKQMVIFEAFQQADGSTSRRYGGTGLGLAISRELARLLGGEISVQSDEGVGSTFTLFLPMQAPAIEREFIDAPGTDANVEVEEMDFSQDLFADDRANISPLDHVALIVEDNHDTAGMLLARARAQGFKGVVAARGYSALTMAREFQPEGITLDVSLPDLDGWKVLSRLKSDLSTRHIPVFIVSADSEPENALKNGAIRFLGKPLDLESVDAVFERMRHMRDNPGGTVLLVEDDETQRNSVGELLSDTPNLLSAGDADEAFRILGSTHCDCVIVDLMLPGTSGFEVIEHIRAEFPQMPIIVYTGKNISADEEAQLSRLTQTIIVKDVRSPERLYDQVALWLHRKVSELPQAGRETVQRLNDPNTLLAGKRVLIVDDDVRNIFAMTSLLERHHMDVMSAEQGETALQLLKSGSAFDIVLMDIMMPEMDGYEVMKAIRGMFGFQELPIIALTAKAMKGDREKCIDAGASDYISKPVDTDRLLTMLRTWLYR
jgi:signal transduction histidine kinase/CheY-like chemotaxis protein